MANAMGAQEAILNLPKAMVVAILSESSWNSVLKFGGASLGCRDVAHDKHLWEVLLQRHEGKAWGENNPLCGDLRNRDCRSILLRNVKEIPTELVFRLCDHEDEILHLSFSFSGIFLATASRDGFSFVYDFRSPTPTLKYRIHLNGGLGSIGSKVGWSPDDQYLALSSIKSNGSGCLEVFRVSDQECTRLWETQSGTFDLYACIHSTGLLYGSMAPADNILSTNLSVFQMNGMLTGNVLLSSELCKWQKNQFHVPVCGQKWFAAITGTNAVQNDILFCSQIAIEGSQLELIGQPIHQIENGPILAVCLTPNEDAVLVNTRPYRNESWKSNLELSQTQFDQTRATEISDVCELHLWALSDSGVQLVAQFSGHKGYTPHDSPFVLFIDTSADGEYIASGSEDCDVHVWNKSHQISHKLRGHQEVVNAVSWRRNHAGQLASASDDHTVCVWGNNFSLQDSDI